MMSNERTTSNRFKNDFTFIDVKCNDKINEDPIECRLLNATRHHHTQDLSSNHIVAIQQTNKKN